MDRQHDPTDSSKGPQRPGNGRSRDYITILGDDLEGEGVAGGAGQDDVTEASLVDALSTLPPKQARLVVFLAAGNTLKASCEAAGFGERHGRKLMREGRFRQVLDAVMRETYRDATRRLTGSLNLAVATMRDVMVDRTSPPGARIAAAAQAWRLSLAVRSMEELEERLAALEARLGIDGDNGDIGDRI